jgi:hypothetical protein
MCSQMWRFTADKMSTLTSSGGYLAAHRAYQWVQMHHYQAHRDNTQYLLQVAPVYDRICVSFVSVRPSQAFLLQHFLSFH